MKRRRLRRKVRMGEHVVVRVPTPATSGYRWQFTEDQSQYRLANETAIQSGTFGGEGITEFSFEPMHPGRIVIHGHLARPWESTPVEELDIVVTAE